MVSALVVVNWESFTGTPGFESPIPWIVATMIGTPIIAWVSYQVSIGKRPKRTPRRAAPA